MDIVGISKLVFHDLVCPSTEKSEFVNLSCIIYELDSENTILRFYCSLCLFPSSEISMSFSDESSDCQVHTKKKKF
jgi:hypothetical protein